MILVWHHIGKKPKGENTVSLKTFKKQLQSIRQTDCTVVPLSRYNPADKHQLVLRFDDGFADLLSAVPVLKSYGFPFEIFIVGDWFGTQGYIGPADVPYLLSNGGRLQWHGKTHTDLTLCSHLETELEVPPSIYKYDTQGFHAVAYPYWKTNAAVEQIAKKYFKYGCSGNGFSQTGMFSLDGIKMQENSSLIQTQNGIKLEIPPHKIQTVFLPNYLTKLFNLTKRR